MSVVDEFTINKVAAPDDTTAPVITLPESSAMEKGTAFDPMEGVSASDDIDGDVTAAIQVSGSVDTSKAGEYTLTYTVTDAAGNKATAVRIVTVTDKTALNALVEDLLALDEDDFTEESWAILQDALTDAQAVQADPSATPQEINAAILELVRAKASLEREIHVDKSGLEQMLELARAAVADPDHTYKPERLNRLNEAIAAGQLVLDNEHATSQQVAEATVALINGLINLQDVVDRDQLNEMIALADQFEEELFTPESWQAFQEALDAAKATADDLNAFPDDIQEAFDDLSDAAAGLELIPGEVDTSALETAIDSAQQILDNVDAYIPATLEGLSEALEEAQAVLADEDATQEEVDDAREALLNETSEVQVKADKRDLIELLARIDAMDLTQYTEASVRALMRIYEEAADALADENATDTVVEGIVNELDAAVGDLVQRPADNGNPGNSNDDDDDDDDRSSSRDDSSTNDNTEAPAAVVNADLPEAPVPAADVAQAAPTATTAPVTTTAPDTTTAPTNAGQPAANSEPSPKTGDNGPEAMAVLLSLAAFGCAIVTRKRK